MYLKTTSINGFLWFSDSQEKQPFVWPNYNSNQKKNLKGNPKTGVTVGVGGFTSQSGVQGDLTSDLSTRA